MRSRKLNWKLGMAALAGVLCLLLCMLGIREYDLNRLQQEFLLKLEENQGEYDEHTIVLVGTNHGRASELARELNAKLRITSDGSFATLTLPEGMTLRAVGENRENRAQKVQF